MAASLVALRRLITSLEHRVIGSIAPLQQLSFPDVTRDPFQALHLDFASIILKHDGVVGGSSGLGWGAGGEEMMECGRGDIRTKRGKRFRGTYGKCRPSAKNRRRRLREKWELPPGAPLPRRHEIA